MAVLATRIWPSWRHTSLQPKGSRLGSPHARPKLGTDFRRRGFAGNRAPISGPVSWKSGLSFRWNYGPGGTAQNVRSTSRGAGQCVSARGVNITWHRPRVQTQETSTSQSIMDFCCVGKMYVASEFFQQDVFLDKTISNFIDYNLTSK